MLTRALVSADAEIPEVAGWDRAAACDSLSSGRSRSAKGATTSRGVVGVGHRHGVLLTGEAVPGGRISHTDDQGAVLPEQVVVQERIRESLAIGVSGRAAETS